MGIGSPVHYSIKFLDLSFNTPLLNDIRVSAIWCSFVCHIYNTSIGGKECVPTRGVTSNKERITFRLTQRYMDILDELVRQGIYNSRNEAIRAGLRVLFEKHGIKVNTE